MARIEDYALIGDTHTAALVSREGSIDWLCLPRFDSGACFAALLGTPEHGRWLLAPAGGVRRTERRYRDDSLVLETEHETEDGLVRVIDCMPPRDDEADVIRVVEGVRGRVPMRTEIVLRFDHGWVVPWVRRLGDGIAAVAGPDAVEVWSDVPLQGRDFRTVGEFSVGEGQRAAFTLTWHPSGDPAPPPLNPGWAIEHADRFWRGWAERCTFQGEWRDAVLRSLLTLKALTYAPSGGIVAAPTTSLPEAIGGVRNWDYRYCWLRDATFTLLALLQAGYEAEARAWRDWLVRAVAGKPSELQIMYGLRGERRLTELELDWLPGYEGSAPVRVGNAASRQFQLDVYGELLDLLHQATRAGMRHEESIWRVECSVLDFLESAWDEPDEGIWEVRGPRRHFTHSKVMAWVAFDRAVRDVERFDKQGPVERWRALRDRIHEEVCREGYDAERGAFVQSYGSKRLDASLLMLPLVGFLPPDDERVRGTVAAVQRELLRDGFVRRYDTDPEVEGVPGEEGAFVMCTLWLADCLVLEGRAREAREMFERVLSIRNDVGLLSEQYDPAAGRMLGNFPQAFSHVSLVDTARNLAEGPAGPAERRRRTGDG